MKSASDDYTNDLIDELLNRKEKENEKLRVDKCQKKKT